LDSSAESEKAKTIEVLKKQVEAKQKKNDQLVSELLVAENEIEGLRVRLGENNS
jgi:hypothetical protein